MSRVEEFIGREISRINRHLPLRRPTLAELIVMDDPFVLLRDGSRHYFRRAELDMISSLLDEDEGDKLRLPIILEISTLYRGYFRVRGEVEIKVINAVIGEGNEFEDGLYPRYLLGRVRRVLPTTTTYAFVAE